jgi:4-amino-4-deoxy-L-arabinose transferase-like glycosyltransferase
VTGSVAVLLYFLWRSLAWPLIHDAAIMHYVAWLISQGAVPYRDAFDMNMPGVYLIHLAVLALGGAGDVAWRTFELGWLGVTAGLMYRYGRPLGDRWSAATPALLFAIHHLAGGASLAGQRDFLICLFLLAGAYGVTRSCESRGRLAPLLGAGLILGFAVMVKPLAALFVVLCAAVAALAAYRAGRSWLAAATTVLLAALVAPALMLGWLAWIGGLRSFVWTLVEWTVPFYSQAGGARSLRVLVSLNWGLLAAAALLGAARRGPVPYDVRRGLAVGGAVYGSLHFALQFKGYDYHLYPLALYLCLLSGLALVPDAGEASARPMRLRAYVRGLPVVLVAAAVIVTGVRGLDRLSQPFEVGRVERVAGAVSELRRLVAPGETAQVMGPSGAHVLLRLGLRQPTRFFTDFQFFLGAADPRIQGLRAEFMAGLEAGAPAAIVMFPERHAAGPYGRLEDFPALAELLEHRYAIVIDNPSYRIYARRPGA